MSSIVQLAETLHLVEKGSRSKEEINIFEKVTKASVIQETKIFNEKVLNEKNCRNVIKNLIYLYNQGSKFNETESTSIFFAITKLFQSNNLELRRMIYRIVREVKHENSFYIITSCLTKDLSSKIDLFKVNALRLMPLVIDSQNMVQSERFIKNAIIDKNAAVSSAALLTAFNVLPRDYDLVKKWGNEINEKLNSKSDQQAQHHSLIVMHEIKKHDKMSFIKTLLGLTKEKLAQLATVQLIRFIKESLLTLEIDSTSEAAMIDYLTKQLRHNNDAVIFEAARALCSLKNITNKELTNAVSVLSVFINSVSSVNKYAALKILNKLISNPIRSTLIQNSHDLELLINDSNKSISSLAIAILLKICKESNVDSLIKQIHESFNDIPDEFKCDIIRSMKALIKKAPTKWKVPMTFVSTLLRASEGSLEIKQSCIDVLIYLVNEFPDSREIVLFHLCDYIEDCLHKPLFLSTLNFLANEIPKTETPSRYLRYVINRLFLEEGDIRSASVGLLGNLGVQREDIRNEILQLLPTCSDDIEDEVRSRSKFYLNVLRDLNENQENLGDIKKFSEPLPLKMYDDIETYIHGVVQQSTNDNLDIFDLKNIINYSNKNNTGAKTDVQDDEDILKDDFLEESKGKEEPKNELLQKKKLFFSSDEHFTDCGDLAHMITEIPLNDRDSEIMVVLAKYFFTNNFIVFEFCIYNQQPDQVLRNVTVELSFDNTETFQIAGELAVSEISPLQNGHLFLTIATHPDHKIPISKSIEAILKFTVGQLNAKGVEENSYQDELQLDNIQILLSDWLVKYSFGNKIFKTEFEKENLQISTSTYQMSFKPVEIAIKNLVNHFATLILQQNFICLTKKIGGVVCEGSDRIENIDKYHTLLLTAKHLNTTPAFIQLIIGIDPKLGCVVKITVKCIDKELADSLVDSLTEQVLNEILLNCILF